MRFPELRLLGVVTLLVAAAGLPDSALAAPLPIAQSPLYLESATPPLNMLVMGKDHKLYYEAYNDASDLNGDGILDVGYKGWQLKTGTVPEGESRYLIDYYGYFNSYACYSYSSGKFTPTGSTNNKTCSGAWSGDFLNYLTTGRGDALKKVLYGGDRFTDTTTSTVLQTNYVPHDAHSWGKEYFSVARDGYNIANYTPLALPTANKYHLFAVTSLTNPDATADGGAPVLRVLRDSPYRIWEWVSIEGPVADTSCVQQGTNCLGSTSNHPGHPNNRAEFTTMENTYAIAANQYGGNVTRNTINCNDGDDQDDFCNPNGSDDDYMTIITGAFRLRDVSDAAGNYQFRVNGDDAIDFEIRTDQNWGNATNRVATAGCYGGRGFGACGGGELTASVALARNTLYYYKFRHEEAGGGDGYQLEWRKTSGTNSFRFDWTNFDHSSNHNNNVNTSGSGRVQPTFRFFNLRPFVSNGSTRDENRFVRVEVCPSGDSNAGVREANCKEYGDDIWKPTGVLHDFGETQRMFFGLLTGSQFNNLQGGVLRSNISDFAGNVDPATGVFTDTDGIVSNLKAIRSIGGSGGEGSNWSWGGGTGGCPALGYRPLNNGECRMWGNPVGEMMFEALRYFAGAEEATPAFATGGASAGTTEETTMGLTTPEWQDPYLPVADGGLGYRACAKPVMTVISDINPSYDSNLPGNPFAAADIDVPDTISSFDADDLGAAMWSHEFGASKEVYIGQSGATYDSAPTVKTVSSFGNIRGLAPEEPTKEGTYYSAAVAFYGLTNDEINPNSRENLATYAVALASPLPRIEFPIGDGKVTLVPFAKSVAHPGSTGNFAIPQDGEFRPTNTIVDFYVERIVNLPGAETDNTINGGNGYAKFRINYEDVEQGNDHDMDVIVTYTITETAQGKVRVQLSSDYQAGSVAHHVGYVISGTTRDGVYLEVRDNQNDTNESRHTRYKFDTPIYPDGTIKWAGDCTGGLAACPRLPNTSLLPLQSDRTFDVGAADGAELLRDPLWYAAKYGGFKDDNRNGVPDAGEWDSKIAGSPDNYFLVTNALTLKEQLTEAFTKIEADSQPTGGVAASGARRDSGFLAYIPRYFTGDWTGDVDAYRLTPDGALGDIAWSAASLVPDADERKIYAVVEPGGSSDMETAEFTSAGLGADARSLLGLPASTTDDQVDDLINYLRGDDSLEEKNGGGFRNRARRLGDILNSQPEVLNSATYSYGRLEESEGGGDAYSDFLKTKVGVTDEDGDVVVAPRRPVLFVGANDGMLHAFDASVGNADSGKELFAVMPNAALGHVKDLASPEYTHRYFADASPIQRDAYIGGSWKTVLLTGLGAGGRSIIALDVTNPAAATGGFTADSILWEFTDPDLGYTFGQPRVGILENGTWVAVFGNGYNSDNHQAYLFVVDLAEGTLLKKIQLGTGTETDRNGLASPELTSLNANIYIDTAYAGDYHGNLWKVNLSGSVSDWGVAGADEDQPMFTAESPAAGTAVEGGRQMITASVALSPHHLGGQMVFFGTGRYMLDGDNAVPVNPDTETFYGIWDKGGVDELVPITGRSELQQQTLGVVGTAEVGLARSASNNAIDWAEQSGWYMDLTLYGGTPVGERVLGLPTVGLGRVVFTSFTPLGDECTPGGENWLYVLNASTGGTSLSTPSFTTSSNTAGDPSLGSCTGGDCAVAAASLGSGAPTVAPPIVTTPPVDPNDPPQPGEPVCTRACSKIKIGVLTPEGTLDFMILTPGRQSWREM